MVTAGVVTERARVDAPVALALRPRDVVGNGASELLEGEARLEEGRDLDDVRALGELGREVDHDRALEIVEVIEVDEPAPQVVDVRVERRDLALLVRRGQ